MIKQDWMEIVAGHELVDALEIEQKSKIKFNSIGYDSNSLCKLQQNQANRGIIGIEIVKSMYGYSVRYDSGLQNFALLARSQELGGTFEGARQFAQNWVNQDKSRRYAWCRKGA